MAKNWTRLRLPIQSKRILLHALDWLEGAELRSGTKVELMIMLLPNPGCQTLQC